MAAGRSERAAFRGRFRYRCRANAIFTDAASGGIRSSPRPHPTPALLSPTVPVRDPGSVLPALLPRAMLILGHLLLDPDRPPSRGWLVLRDGRIVDMGHDEAGNGTPPDAIGVDGKVCGDPDTLVVPGFIDAHMHLPQIDSIGVDGLDLLPWLERVIFPAEAAWCDPLVALRQTASAMRRLRAVGTVGVGAFASPIAGAMTSVVEAVSTAAGDARVRMAVGQALMDRGGPDALTREPIWQPPVGSSPTPDIEISVNPRFAVSCSDALLEAAGNFARTLSDPLIHTHLAESPEECATVAALFPDDDSYTSVYDRHRLLGPRTLLAHAIHLGPAEWRTIAERNAVVVHCPQANTFLRSGLFDLRAAREHGVRLALGSDIAAGCDLAMPRVGRAMIEVAKLRSMTIDPTAPIPTPAEVWRMITEGNANALGWHDSGRIAIGARADLLLLRVPWPLDDDARNGTLIGRLLHAWESVSIAEPPSAAP